MSSNRHFFTAILCLSLLPLMSCSTLFSRGNSLDDLAQTDPIASIAARLRDSRTKGSLEPDENAQNVANDIQLALAHRNITVGMQMSDVKTVWGEPEKIATAGEPQFGNQRWTYFDGLSAHWKINNTRVVYFEDGRVVGWERNTQ